MNSKLSLYLINLLAQIDKLDTDRQITNRKRYFLGQRMIIQGMLEANARGEFDPYEDNPRISNFMRWR
jgi:hypothetical protein